MRLLRRIVLGAFAGFCFLAGATLVQAATESGVYVDIRASDLPGAPVTERWKLYGASHALVIGIDNYTNGWPRLSNAVKDATLVATELAGPGQGRDPHGALQQIWTLAAFHGEQE